MEKREGGGYERKTLMKTKGAKDKKNAREKEEKKKKNDFYRRKEHFVESRKAQIYESEND